MDWWNPIDWGRDVTERTLEDIFWHVIMPVVLVLLAVATLIFSPMRLRWKVFFILVFLLGAAYLWGMIPWVS